MNGVELSERLQQRRPEIKVLFVSGYTKDALVEPGIAEDGVAFLAKPYTLEALREKIRNLIHGSSRVGDSAELNPPSGR